MGDIRQISKLLRFFWNRLDYFGYQLGTTKFWISKHPAQKRTVKAFFFWKAQCFINRSKSSCFQDLNFLIFLLTSFEALKFKA